MFQWTKNSKNGTGLMASEQEKTLKVTDIQAIMELCTKHNVLKLKFESLSIEFDRPTNTNRTTPEIDPVPPVELEKAERDAILRDEVALREEQIREMHITNPLLAEELLTDGDLESDDESSD